MRPHLLLTSMLVLFSGCSSSLMRPTRADALDRIAEGEQTLGSRAGEDEISRWYRVRVKRRSLVAELQMQRTRSARLARLQKQPGALSLATARRILQSRSRRLPGAAPASPRPEQSGGQWVKVPVEVLDANGQAVDKEGDDVLRNTYKEKRSK